MVPNPIAERRTLTRKQKVQHRHAPHAGPQTKFCLTSTQPPKRKLQENENLSTDMLHMPSTGRKAAAVEAQHAQSLAVWLIVLFTRNLEASAMPEGLQKNLCEII